MLLLSNGTITIQRLNGASQLLYNVFGVDSSNNPIGVPALAYRMKFSDAINIPDMPGPSSPDTQQQYSAYFTIKIGGVDENPDIISNYQPQKGDLVVFTGAETNSRLNGTYRQIIDTTPQEGLGLDYIDLPVIRLKTTPTSPGSGTAPGGGGSGGTESYTFNQLTPSAQWIINHNLNKQPLNISVEDTNGNQLMGAITYTSSNSVVISFTQPYAGTALLDKGSGS